MINVKAGLYSLYYRRWQYTLHHNSFITNWKSQITANYSWYHQKNKTIHCWGLL